MNRTFVILRHTFVESIVQPIYSLLLGLGSVVLVVFGMLPYFTLGEDTTMYKSVCLDIVLLLTLIVTLFATSKSIFDEIEDRTMLTLMSKPVQRWEVLVGKYLGIVMAALLAVGVLGLVTSLAIWLRVPNDYLLRTGSLDDREVREIMEYRWMHLAGFIPSLVLVWLQVSVLAGIGVAISTRFSLVVNLPSVILIYIAGNLTRFLFPLPDDAGFIHTAIARLASWILPYLSNFDLRGPAIYHDIKLAGTRFAFNPNSITISAIWGFVGLTAAYAIAYTVFSLSIGMWIFQRRELGGNEG